ncbi:MAG: hypothetical protein HC873_11340 [Leptolyngbyaceae cyanobacterium SL_1_1]|nr:hypothetical protein [Leptolyngbyaceae cyanobacterium SL_1_1]
MVLSLVLSQIIRTVPTGQSLLGELLEAIALKIVLHYTAKLHFKDYLE